jgi:hypothetical protein
MSEVVEAHIEDIALSQHRRGNGHIDSGDTVSWKHMSCVSRGTLFSYEVVPPCC